MPGCRVLRTSAGEICFDRTRLMGVVNVTPDSFYDRGRYAGHEQAVRRALELEQQGADVVDIGGESTRPGSPRVAEEEEKRRVVPVVEAVAKRAKVPISIDTYKAGVAVAALDAGAAIVNDVTALRGDPEMAGVVGRRKVPVVLMHALWPPETMQADPHYVDVVEDVIAFLEERVRLAVGMGVPRDAVVVDPGIGFGKTLAHNLALLAGLARFMAMGHGVLVGPSRKAFIGMLTDKEAEQRLLGTAGAVAVCAAAGVHLVRVHDVAEMRDVVRVVDAICWGV